MIELRNLCKRFEERELRYHDAVFKSGESCLLMGASGAGKTTLFNLISGIMLPSGGEVIIDGVSTKELGAEGRNELRTKRVGYVFQDFRLLEEMTARDNIRILELSGVPSFELEETAETLGILGLLDRRVKTLSGGEKQRVAIARALVRRPEIILADEPTGNLDGETGEAIIRLLLACSQNKTLIVASHDISLKNSFARVLELQKGAGE